MNRDAFRLTALLQRIRQGAVSGPFQAVLLVLRGATRVWNQSGESIHQARRQLALPRLRRLVIADHVACCDRCIRDQVLIFVERTQDLSHNGEHAHAIAYAVRSHEQQVALPLRLQHDRAELRLIIGEYSRQLKLALPSEVILLHASKDSERNLRCTVFFVVQSVPLLTNQGAQCGMLSLHTPERQPEPLRIDAAFQSYEVDDVAVDHMLDGGQLSSHASPPVSVTGELLSTAICLGSLLLQKAAIRGCRCSKVPSRP